MRSSKSILLVEDDTLDAMTVKRALNDINVKNELVHVKNGEQAIEYLESNTNNLPCIILLDLNMPIMNGREFLKERLKYDKFVTIPVVVLTTSKDDEDKLESFRLSISGYMAKPVDYNQFVEVIKTINMYWTISEVVTEH
ncbi:MAG: response regulator [Cyclobacteriaceae bacterium]|nr:response regulator [Cyclobacteriaceae bacterium]